MVTSRQIKEKIRDYRRSIKHSWLLFKESRIGLIGLSIMVVFVVMALISPYLGLRHPLDWWAPDEDIQRLESTFDNMPTRGEAFETNYRRATRGEAQYYYLTGGEEGHPIYGYGLYAYSPDTGDRVWGARPFRTPPDTQIPSSRITTNIYVGRIGSTTGTDWRVAIGCEDGRFFVLNDESRDSPPTTELGHVHERMLNGTVVGVDGFVESRVFIASTANGWLYAFRLTSNNNLALMWGRQVSDYPLSKPAVQDYLGHIYVGSADGFLYGLDVNSGTLLPNWNAPYVVSESYWSGSPTVTPRGTLPAIVYAASDDGIVHSVYGDNGTVREGWAHLAGVDLKPGLQLKHMGVIDGGNLTEVRISGAGERVFVGSSTGMFYLIDTGVPIEYGFDTKIGLLPTSIETLPGYNSGLSPNALALAARNMNGTADPSDDFSIIYYLRINSTAILDDNPELIFNISWRKTVDGVVLATPIAEGYTTIHNIAIATVFYDSDGTPMPGEIHSYETTGRIITPLPPTWLTKDGAEDAKYQPPPSGNYYWLGTDNQGHDILSQTILGSRVALLVGFLSAFFSISIGVIVGLVAGFHGKGIDAVLMRFTDVILVLPGLPLLIVLAAILNPSIWNIILLISIIGWGGVARVIRAEVLSLKERPFIDSARVTGASKSRIMFKHIAPNVLPLGLLYMTFAVSGAIMAEASLAFIGLGDPSTMTWGMMLNYVQHSNALTNWWWLLPPGICITLVCLAFFLLGRAFDEIVNPRLRRRR